MKRRRFLGLAGASAVAGLAGCGGNESTGESIEDHPAATDLEAQPRQGDLGGHVVLTFEDPSCERCAAFHENTVPEMRSALVDPGLGAYVVRTYPVIFPWGEPATYALEATFDRDEDAFWSLLEHYFARRGQFNQDNVLRLTAEYLDSETGLDGGQIAADAENRTYEEQVQADIQAAEDAGLGQTTPVVLLFRDGNFVTKVNGSVSYDVIAEALGEAE
ncbi:DsbA family protein [Halomicroarcula sp. GCM10025324]|uniref:DsbA family protein n=1 Tax=Haloarcula TaxID=2237 RepID=UPI0023E85A09|nr:thioredoxin domain-containing protein [Halomicroarcula sp. ZS-22-S1]